MLKPYRRRRDFVNRANFSLGGAAKFFLSRMRQKEQQREGFFLVAACRRRRGFDGLRREHVEVCGSDG
jgi:hypothetical protein